MVLLETFSSDFLETSSFDAFLCLFWVESTDSTRPLGPLLFTDFFEDDARATFFSTGDSLSSAGRLEAPRLEIAFFFSGTPSSFFAGTGGRPRDFAFALALDLALVSGWSSFSVSIQKKNRYCY